MPFPGEDRYREALARAKGHEGDAAMVRVDDLVAALAEIERLRTVVDVAENLRALVTEGDVPRYSVTPGAALNTVVSMYDRVRGRLKTAQ